MSTADTVSHLPTLYTDLVGVLVGVEADVDGVTGLQSSEETGIRSKLEFKLRERPPGRRFPGEWLS